MPQDFPFNPDDANTQFPYNPFTGDGDEDDDARYILRPGEDFKRPWLAVPGGMAFIWPLPVEGFDLSIEPTLGKHRYIGDNAVKVDVIHKGEETITLDGNFPGLTGAATLRALRDVVYADTPSGGKILALPGILPYAQRVVVSRASFSRSQDDRGNGFTYSIEFAREGLAEKFKNEPIDSPIGQPPVGGKGSAPRTFVVTAKFNTLRKIASHLFNDANRWRELYNKNTALFKKLGIPLSQAPNHKLAKGRQIKY